MPIFDHFNWIAPLYDRVAGSVRPVDLGRFFDLDGNQVMLDLGGGTGRASAGMCSQVSALLVADPAFNMLTQARAKGCIQSVGTEAENLPFSSKSFDGIVMVDAFHHLADQPLVVREMWRVLRPGGRAVIEEPDIARAAVKFIAIAEKVLLMRSHFRRPDWIAAQFASLGASVEIEREGLNAWIVAKKGR